MPPKKKTLAERKKNLAKLNAVRKKQGKPLLKLKKTPPLIRKLRNLKPR